VLTGPGGWGAWLSGIVAPATRKGGGARVLWGRGTPQRWSRAVEAPEWVPPFEPPSPTAFLFPGGGKPGVGVWGGGWLGGTDFVGAACRASAPWRAIALRLGRRGRKRARGKLPL